jgi:hypothetical protein
MRFRILPALALGAAVAGCADLDLTNPNAPSTSTFWRTGDQALSGLNATYNALLNNGTYGRWYIFANDLRSDIGRAMNFWPELGAFARTEFPSGYDFEINREIWQHHYEGIFRANQVIANVPNIQGMDVARRDRYVAEAKFIRALLYYNLVTLYENVPLVLTVPTPGDRPATAEPAAIWAQIEKDLTEARPGLPLSYSGGDVGRATRGAAGALLGKARLQQRKWADAATVLQEVISSGQYDLVPNYAENFTALNENNRESVFEVQFGERALLSQGVRGLNIARMVGPCGPSYCDGRPTRWYFDQFQTSRTTTGAVDPRLDATLYYPGGPLVYNRTYESRYPAGSPDAGEIFFKKYGEYYLGLTDQDWDAAINFRVIRYADVLLMRAEALNEASGPSAEAIGLVNRVRTRVNLPALTSAQTATREAFRDAILRERMFEFGLEGQRWNDLKRHNLLSPALASRDPEFSAFVIGKSERLPIPQTERDLNPNVKQNPGW